MADASQGQACDRCHRRKTRCDKQRPTCGPCQRAKAGCIYSERAKQSMYRREFVESLERRIHQLEATNRRLTTVASAVSAVSASTPRTTSSNVQPPNDVASEVSFLSTSAGGDRQFLGSTSGILLASLVKAGLTLTPESQPYATASSISPSASTSGPNWGPDDTELPPEQLSRSLVEAYLAHDHLSYPFLHPQAVQATVDSIYNDATFPRSHPFETFMFNMILAIATSQVYKFNWQVLPDAETHHHRAMTHLNNVLCKGGLRTLQAMLLLCQFRLSSSTKDASGSLWHLVGIAARMCFELGLHRETMYKLNKSSITHEDSCLSPKFEENEIRRRCFWSVFALDRVVSITLGRPLAIRPEDVDVDLPSEDLSEASSPSAMSPEDGQAASQIPQSYRTGLFVHLVRYRDICGRCLTSLHRGSRTVGPSESDLHRVRTGLAQELELWRAATNNLDLSEMDLTTCLAEARSSFRSKAWYELLYHNGVLLLYRPTSSSNPIHADSVSLQQLFSTAKQSTTLYAYLLRSRKINFSWITMHSVFMAGLSYIYALSRHFREKKRRPFATGSDSPRVQLAEEPSIMDIVNTCRACSNVLVAVSERCNAQKNCHEVFDRLSDAVLADAVASISKIPNPDMTGTNASLPLTSASDVTVQMQNDPFEGGGSASTQPQEGDVSAAQADNFLSLAVDNAFIDCFPDLKGIGDARWGDDAILQLSIDWLEEIDPGMDVAMDDWTL